MFNTMTITKAAGALIGSLLFFLLGAGGAAGAAARAFNATVDLE